MTNLKCSAHNCYYNKNSLCSRGAINVEGADARYADDTACESFRAQEEGSVKMPQIPAMGVRPLTSTAKHTTVPTMSTANAPQLPSMYPVPMLIAAVIQNVILFTANADILNGTPVSIRSSHSCFF